MLPTLEMHLFSPDFTSSSSKNEEPIEPSEKAKKSRNKKKRRKIAGKSISLTPENFRNSFDIAKVDISNVHRLIRTNSDLSYTYFSQLNQEMRCTLMNAVLSNYDALDESKKKEFSNSIKKLERENIRGIFNFLDTLEKRKAFIQLMSDSQKAHITIECSNEELDFILESIEDVITSSKKEHITKCSLVLSPLSQERLDQYFSVFTNPEDPNFSDAIKEASENKLNLVFKEIWLKKPILLKKVILIRNFLINFEYGQFIINRNMTWRLDELDYEHWAALIPVFSCKTLNDLRKADLLKFKTELIVYSMLSYNAFIKLHKKDKINPKVTDLIFSQIVFSLNLKQEIKREIDRTLSIKEGSLKHQGSKSKNWKKSCLPNSAR